jgi:hypothetical protein
VTGSVASADTLGGTEITAVQWVALEQVTLPNAVPKTLKVVPVVLKPVPVIVSVVFVATVPVLTGTTLGEIPVIVGYTL